jgi:hypothetical protein
MKSLATALAISASLVGSALAEVQTTSGGVVEIAPPPSVLIDALESDTEIRAFNEIQDVTLSGDVEVNISLPGTYDGSIALTPTTIGTGSAVCSHLLHADRVGSEAYVRVSGSVTFSSDILGVIVLAPELNASDGILGAAGTLYPTGSDTRDLELSSTEDSVTLESNLRTLTVNLRFGQVVDQIRVLTAARPVPVEGMSWGRAKALYR